MKHPEQPFEPGNEYVLGFAFLKGRGAGAVLLIKKTKPTWQAGFLNGVGGKVEESDWCLAEAMRREFKEETSIDTEVSDWHLFAQHLKPGTANGDQSSYSLHMFVTELNTEQMFQQQTTDEEPMWFELSELGHLLESGVNGCAMYVAMALNHLGRQFFTTTIETTDHLK